jgi:hypothetical protein
MRNVSGRLQLAHSRRARRCAVIKITLDAMLKGAMPMLRMRVSVVGRIIGVQRGQEPVPGLCSLDGNVGCFQVPDFAHHDDVRILAQKRLEGDGKGQPRLFVDVDLVDARQVDFGGVFCRGDVDPGLVEQFRQV